MTNETAKKAIMNKHIHATHQLGFDDDDDAYVLPWTIRTQFFCSVSRLKHGPNPQSENIKFEILKDFVECECEWKRWKDQRCGSCRRSKRGNGVV
ncbi:hypothetical protein Q3G72_011874 [Acer saccharum]|nr:hypothetical protein Q3G72_011874 [Acer saccharum]